MVFGANFKTDGGHSLLRQWVFPIYLVVIFMQASDFSAFYSVLAVVKSLWVYLKTQALYLFRKLVLSWFLSDLQSSLSIGNQLNFFFLNLILLLFFIDLLQNSQSGQYFYILYLDEGNLSFQLFHLMLISINFFSQNPNFLLVLKPSLQFECNTFDKSLAQPMSFIADDQLSLSRKDNVGLLLLEGVLNHLTEDSPVAQKQITIVFEGAEFKLILEQQRELILFVENAYYQLFVLTQQLYFDSD